MRFLIENINKIRKADIVLNGLTVIAGENDSGKSTVGKLLFSTIKALETVDRQTDSKQESLLQKYVQSLYRRLSRKIRTENKILDKFFPLLSGRFVSELQALREPSLIDNFLQTRIDVVRQIEGVTPRIRELMLQDIKSISICLKETGNQAASVATEIQYFIESEFMNKICSNQKGHSYVELYLEEQKKPTLSYTIKEEKVGKVILEEDIDSLQDATYVESPLYIHLLDALLRSVNYREMGDERLLFRSMVPIHIKDFAEKLNAMKYLVRREPSLFGNNMNRVVKELQTIVGGRFTFDAEKRNLCFEKDKMKYSPINIASGIKSFGVVQMLLETNAINENKILIWDEPENHLHPQWQIEFAHLLVELAKVGIPIVISTHSPYFIQGIRHFSAKQEMEKFVNYYLADTKEGGLSVMEEVSDDLNRIFVKLAEPLNRIMNL